MYSKDKKNCKSLSHPGKIWIVMLVLSNYLIDLLITFGTKVFSARIRNMSMKSKR